jgi:hypothetical protein
MLSPETKVRTLGVLAEEVGAPASQVNYILRRCGIQHIGRAGTLRLFDGAAVNKVRAAIADMEARRSGKRNFVCLFAGTGHDNDVVTTPSS